VAREFGATVVPAHPRGFGAAAHAGLLAAEADVVCFLDADGSLDPRQLPRVAAAVLDGRADLVLGRRRPTAARAWPLHARLGNAAVAWRLRRLVNAPVRDLGPMRAARRVDLLGLGLTDRRFGYPLEMVLKAGRAGWRISEVDVAYAPRAEGGRSKVTGTVSGTLRTIRDMSRVLGS
jgi:glycosyltransferase involved in cell wall biosynthesis